jgi:catechol 2,3-dioxygenase-like lactoylglutathione lyase family enzyme
MEDRIMSMSATKRGIPGSMGVDHVALTIPDLDAAVAFYCDVIGGSELYRLGPFDAKDLPRMPDGRDWTEAHVNVAGARVWIAMVQLRGGMLLELFRYDEPAARRTDPVRNCDLGGHHIAIRVESLDAAKSYLVERGLRVMAGPIVIPEGPCAGLRTNYFLDPWGNQLEIIEYGELPFMRTVPGYQRRP